MRNIDAPTSAPARFRSARSWMKPRNGAIPLPAPIITIGASADAGG